MIERFNVFLNNDDFPEVKVQVVRHSDHEREVAALRAALQWYADNLGASKSMDYRIVHQDAGERARAALNQSSTPKELT